MPTVAKTIVGTLGDGVYGGGWEERPIEIITSACGRWKIFSPIIRSDGLFLFHISSTCCLVHNSSGKQ